MLFESGSFTGNGTRKFIRCGFKPKLILWKTNTTQFMGFWCSNSWVGRSIVLGAAASYIDGIRESDKGFYVGSSTIVNNLATTTYWIAIGDDGTSDFDIMSWCGNSTAGRTLSLPAGKKPIAALIKRDSARDGAYKVGSNSTVFTGGSTATDCIALTGAGVVTLTAANEVNEYSSAGGLGEGTDGIFFYGGKNSTTVTWIGDGTTGRVIPLGIANPVAVLVAHPSVGTSSRLITDAMAGLSAPVAATAAVANEATLSGSNLVIGSSTTPLNANGIVYGATVFSRNLTSSLNTPLIRIKNNQAIYLPANGIASYIDCGTSDATLNITGAISYEWCGALYHNGTAAITNESVMIARGNGAYNTVGGYSWSVLGCSNNDGSLGWSGAHYAPQLGNVMNMAPPLDQGNWRSGILIPYGQIQHMITTVAADGTNLMYVNGKLVKQGKNTVSTGVAPTAGHPTTIGARKSTGVAVRNTRLLMKEIAIYSRVLTQDEVSARYARAMLGSTATTDVTTNRAAYWSANNAGGALLPDEVNSANNGTIVLGNIVTL